MKNEIFDSASEPRLHHPKLKHKLLKNTQEEKEKRLYPIKSDYRLKKLAVQDNYLGQSHNGASRHMSVVPFRALESNMSGKCTSLKNS
jgi:hypothetical protein